MSDDTRTAILDAFRALRKNDPHTPAIVLAERLDISEGALQAARIGEDVMTIDLAPRELAARFKSLGPVKALTRSRHAVLEQRGEYPPLSGGAHAGLLLAPGGLDLRLLFGQWYWACLIRDALPSGERLSLQIFDRHGRALHKVFCEQPTSPEAWEQLWQAASTDEPCFVGQASPAGAPTPTTPPPGLGDDWAAMTDVHQFFGLLRRYQLSRRDANMLMQGRFTRPLPSGSVEQLLRGAATQGQPLMLFVASPGCVQIRTGCVPQPERRRGWLNLFADDATLHLEDAAIDRVWAVLKPNADGGVTSLEAFDTSGDLVLQIYGERREGAPEAPAWRALLASLELTGTAA
ncbi:ChuX/HutX family heme-like substrate-binding protein [Halomonas sp. V046]|uniref:ChuX/HutX family heme-like substrate-binding protein n=1 Tax=Halomonas sp. V046 TaxID=3459611 RepID=UPI0040443FDF